VPRKYTGNKDGNYGKAREGTLELLRMSSKRFGMTNLGTYSNRRMNNAKANADPTNPKYLSVHATGRAVDLGYQNRDNALALWNFLITNTAQLGIEEIHDYAYKWPQQDPKDKTAWGAGYRCSRGEGLAGVKIFTAKDNAGTPGGKWLHVELAPHFADDAKAFRAAWIDALKRSGLK
jgi:hypothetical protein